ncbi:MAG TPA: ATP-binding protein, partial [Nitrospiria bacterium]|nr:ATP-binding protein [Nitrospiria bacterium]
SLMTRKLELKRASADLNSLVNLTIDELGHSNRPSLVRDLHPLPPLLIDREQIQKVLVNLVLNGMEAVKENGEIQVTTSQSEGWVNLSVRDNGCGMTPEYLSKSLFHPFQTTKSKGLGIGLFQCKTIVEAHGGKIEVESEAGKGSLFRVILPVK